MRNRLTKATAAATAITGLLTTSCGVSPVPIPADTDQMSLVLSRLILYPQINCEELRRTFGVGYLTPVESPAELGLDFEQHWAWTDNGQVVRIWYLPSKLERGSVLLSLGAAGSMPCFLFHARMLVNNGWSVVMYEYEGFGYSDGEASVDTLVADARIVLDWMQEYTQADQITVMGISLGTIPSIALAVEQPELINGLILDSPVALGALIRQFEFALLDRTQAFIDRLLPEIVSEELADDIEQPLLVLQGTHDALTSPDSAFLIYERAAGPKTYVPFPGVGHARAPFRDFETYAYYVESFLAEVWSQHVPLIVEIRNPPDEN